MLPGRPETGPADNIRRTVTEVERYLFDRDETEFRGNLVMLALALA